MQWEPTSSSLDVCFSPPTPQYISIKRTAFCSTSMPVYTWPGVFCLTWVPSASSSTHALRWSMLVCGGRACNWTLHCPYSNSTSSRVFVSTNADAVRARAAKTQTFFSTTPNEVRAKSSGRSACEYFRVFSQKGWCRLVSIFKIILGGRETSIQ